MLKEAFNKVKSLNNLLDEYKICISFIASFSIFIIAQLTDITYYDGKISIIFSVLLACLKNIIDENNYPKKIFK